MAWSAELCLCLLARSIRSIQVQVQLCTVLHHALSDLIKYLWYHTAFSALMEPHGGVWPWRSMKWIVSMCCSAGEWSHTVLYEIKENVVALQRRICTANATAGSPAQGRLSSTPPLLPGHPPLVCEGAELPPLGLKILTAILRHSTQYQSKELPQPAITVRCPA